MLPWFGEVEAEPLVFKRSKLVSFVNSFFYSLLHILPILFHNRINNNT